MRKLLAHAREHQAHLAFLDESGLQLEPNVCRGYAQVGQIPVLTCSAERQRISAISCVTIDPGLQDVELYFRLLDPNQNVCGTDMVDFLNELHQHVPRLLVVWDGASNHVRSRQVTSFWRVNRT